MSMCFSELLCKEVICVCDGRRLGFVHDVKVEMPEGLIVAIVVPGPGRLGGLGAGKYDYLIPWRCIKRIGPDIVLVDIRPEECRVPRGKPVLPFFPGK